MAKATAHWREKFFTYRAPSFKAKQTIATRKQRCLHITRLLTRNPRPARSQFSSPHAVSGQFATALRAPLVARNSVPRL
jgi:hypothetical protein